MGQINSAVHPQSIDPSLLSILIKESNAEVAVFSPDSVLIEIGGTSYRPYPGNDDAVLATEFGRAGIHQAERFFFLHRRLDDAQANGGQIPEVSGGNLMGAGYLPMLSRPDQYDSSFQSEGQENLVHHSVANTLEPIVGRLRTGGEA